MVCIFGVASSSNDINMLDCSLVFDEILDGQARSLVFDEVLDGWAPEVNYIVNGTNYNMEYYLIDSIYPD